jgi:hypothetical protein
MKSPRLVHTSVFDDSEIINDLTIALTKARKFNVGSASCKLQLPVKAARRI